jgi:hypothetical protein
LFEDLRPKGKAVSQSYMQAHFEDNVYMLGWGSTPPHPVFSMHVTLPPPKLLHACVIVSPSPQHACGTSTPSSWHACGTTTPSRSCVTYNSVTFFSRNRLVATISRHVFLESPPPDSFATFLSRNRVPYMSRRFYAWALCGERICVMRKPLVTGSCTCAFFFLSGASGCCQLA